MTLDIVTVPCLSDNYAYLARDPATGTVAVVDVPEAGPIREALSARGWTLSDILITHHHGDHVDGVAELREATGARVTGAAADRHRLPPLDREVADGDTVTIGGETGHVLDVSGHSVGHIAFHFPESSAAFTADSLMALGCGRVFEGTPTMMWESLSRLAALPAETKVYSGHEYTAKNADFALTVEPENAALTARAEAVRQARRAGEPTVPSDIAEERATNPFLRAGHDAVKAALGMEAAPDAAVFGEIRRRKDAF